MTISSRKILPYFQKLKVWQKMVLLEDILRFTSKSDRVKTEIFPAWLANAGAPFKKAVLDFDAKLKKLLVKNNAVRNYQKALESIASWGTSSDLEIAPSNPPLLFKFFEYNPEIFNFLYTELCEKSVLEKAHSAYWKEYDKEEARHLMVQLEEATSFQENGKGLAPFEQKANNESKKIDKRPRSTTTKVILMTNGNTTPVTVSEEAFEHSAKSLNKIFAKLAADLSCIPAPLTVASFANEAKKFTPEASIETNTLSESAEEKIANLAHRLSVRM